MDWAAVMQESVQETDDSGLEARLRRGEAGAFDEFVGLYQARVTRLVHRLLGWDAEVQDVVQDVFLAAFTHLSSFRNESSLSTWLTRIAVNRCRTVQRRRGVWRRIEQVLGRRAAPQAAPADSPAQERERGESVRAAVGRLRGRDREAIVLFYLEHKSVEQISEIFGCSRSAIDVRLYRARAKLRDLLAGQFEDDAS